MAANAEHGDLLDLVAESYSSAAWHGPNLRGSLRGCSASMAAWRPAGDRHSIWELALHCAYWEYAVTRRLAGGKRGSFPRKPSNFPGAPPKPGPARWKEDLALLDETHRRLVGAVRSVLPSANEASASGRRVRRLIRGIACHNVYHAGQIRLLIRLSGAKSRKA